MAIAISIVLPCTLPGPLPISAILSANSLDAPAKAGYRNPMISDFSLGGFSLLAGLFASAFTSATLLPGTSEAALAALIAAGHGPVWLFVAVATTGNVAGSLVNWLLGRGIERFRDRKWFPVTPAQLTRAEGWFARYGLWSLLLSWLPVIGDPLTLLAGVMRIRLMPFLLLVTLGKAARYGAIAGGMAAIAQMIGA